MGMMFDPGAMQLLGYGLYVLTTRDGDRDNGCIVNSVMQAASAPPMIAVSLHHNSYTCKLVQKTGLCNICCLVEDTPYEVFQHFSNQSGKELNKFADCEPKRSTNGLIVLPKYIGGFLSLAVAQELKLGSNSLFLCTPTEGRVLSDEKLLTYAYFQEHIMPKTRSQE